MDAFILLRVPEEIEEEALAEVERWLAPEYCMNGCVCGMVTFADENGGLPSNVFCPNCGRGFTPRARKRAREQPRVLEFEEILPND
ncbi:MAG: hypothetical protein G01um1014106_472 [Parcubacteria group bacterium Gr01-1014_106]|nr:MAG: hypothetical protein G01um1014106_472 [Parcubacteria group bacterium Gr01-1014_106]